mmetsp:Transcript_11927/g.36077  ORF Transcript_11927/g.36077 Transcript_11927/m.36077 type:complete len:491 (-) Transcript_11927:220-1692(-)
MAVNSASRASATASRASGVPPPPWSASAFALSSSSFFRQLIARASAARSAAARGGCGRGAAQGGAGGGNGRRAPLLQLREGVVGRLRLLLRLPWPPAGQAVCPERAWRAAASDVLRAAARLRPAAGERGAGCAFCLSAAVGEGDAGRRDGRVAVDGRDAGEACRRGGGARGPSLLAAARLRAGGVRRRGQGRGGAARLGDERRRAGQLHLLGPGLGREVSPRAVLARRLSLPVHRLRVQPRVFLRQPSGGRSPLLLLPCPRGAAALESDRPCAAAAPHAATGAAADGPGVAGRQGRPGGCVGGAVAPEAGGAPRVARPRDLLGHRPRVNPRPGSPLVRAGGAVRRHTRRTGVQARRQALHADRAHLPRLPRPLYARETRRDGAPPRHRRRGCRRAAVQGAARQACAAAAHLCLPRRSHLGVAPPRLQRRARVGGLRCGSGKGAFPWRCSPRRPRHDVCTGALRSAKGSFPACSPQSAMPPPLVESDLSAQ